MATQQQTLAFSGTGSEYFKIWIVNSCLSILTLGIYSAWAKVRRLQYFYRHTQIADAFLDYHGNPVAILKGRAIAFVLFFGYSFFIKTNPLVGLGFLALIMAAAPWLLVRSFRFQLHNTSYRGLRFSFHGQTGKAFVTFLLMPLLAYITLGLCWPLARQKITHYLRNNSSYANCPFAFHGTAGEFYKIYLTTFALMTGLLVAVIFVCGLPALGGERHADLLRLLMVPSAILMFLFGTLFIIDYFSARLQNFIWNHTTLDGIRIVSTLRVRELFVIGLGNAVLVLLTLGLYKPYADIRMARYRIGCIALQVDADIDAFMAERQQEVAATGEEIAEMFDIDIAF